MDGDECGKVEGRQGHDHRRGDPWASAIVCIDKADSWLFGGLELNTKLDWNIHLEGLETLHISHLPTGAHHILGSNTILPNKPRKLLPSPP